VVEVDPGEVQALLDDLALDAGLCRSLVGEALLVIRAYHSGATVVELDVQVGRF